MRLYTVLQSSLPWGVEWSSIELYGISDRIESIVTWLDLTGVSRLIVIVKERNQGIVDSSSGGASSSSSPNKTGNWFDYHFLLPLFHGFDVFPELFKRVFITFQPFMSQEQRQICPRDPFRSHDNARMEMRRFVSRPQHTVSCHQKERVAVASSFRGVMGENGNENETAGTPKRRNYKVDFSKTT